jgi:hypothetical protein
VRVLRRRDPVQTALIAAGGLALLVVVAAAVTWLLLIAALVVAVGVLNLIYLPRAATFLRLRSGWLALILIPFMVLAGGLIGGGPEGAAWGLGFWLVAIGLPRAIAGDLMRRLRRRVDSRMNVRVYDADSRSC